ncbi:MAG: carboxypeptidase-like regulatory domain-containing protein [Bacteroidaceae bacterium]|nr:carboxypeptidase-like regulatory domain-containing protein [Bacteroidaceae bacterium]
MGSSKRIVCLLAFVVVSAVAWSQEWVTGRITDAKSGEALPLVHVYYDDNKRGGVVADVKGRYRIKYRVGRTLTFDIMGYEVSSVITNRPGTRNVKMCETSYDMQEVVVEKKRTKYRRKNNPAVDLMRRVIAAKHLGALDSLPYYKYNVYEKQTLSINDYMSKSHPDLVDSMSTGRRDSVGGGRMFDFLFRYAEKCEATGKTILPLMVEEKLKQRIHRSDPEADKTFVVAKRTQGVNELLAIGSELSVVLGDLFQDVNIYEDDVRLFQRHFLSPIANSAIGFYRYYIEDTIQVEDIGRADSLVKCVRLTFTPNNPQDFGFSGELLVRLDSTWQVHSSVVNIPSRSGVNFVDDLRITQTYETLANGRRIVAQDDMLVQMSLVDFLSKLQVERTTRRSDYSFNTIPDQRFRGLAKEEVDPAAERRDEAYWQRERPMALTEGERRIDTLVADLNQVGFVKVVRFLVQAYGENFIEPVKNGPVDIGPIRSLISFNSIEGVRLLVGGQTTATLHPNWFLRGYAAYGFKDRKWKGLAEVTYSFRKKKYRPHEFPVHSLSAQFSEELMTMPDRKLGRNRSDLFSFLSWGRGGNFKMYQRAYRLTYQYEWENGLQLTLKGTHERLKPAGDLLFQPLNGLASPSTDPAANITHYDNTEFGVVLRYQPNNTYANNKQARVETNKDAPIYQISHTVSPRGLWGNKYMSNVTEFEFYRRVWLSSWGRMDFTVRGAYQWNRVPFFMLNAPDANQTLVMYRRRFCLIDNLEFLNDRNISVHWKWDLAGKLFNRIPFLRRLHLRETIGFNLLWGDLSAQNNPEANPTDSRLWRFPGRWNGEGQWEQYGERLNPRRPYIEVYAGIYNILKFFNITYVHRLTYTDNPDTQRWGIRVGLELAF